MVGYCHSMPAAWGDLAIPDADFSVAALAASLDAKRQARGLSWNALANEMNHDGERRNAIHLISTTTPDGLARRRWGVEGDGVLQMLIWLGLTPESFVHSHPGANHPDAQLPRIDPPRVLRFDVPAIHAKLNATRQTSGLSWSEAADQMGGLCNARMLQAMCRQSRVDFPQVMRLARWLRCPCASLTRITNI